MLYQMKNCLVNQDHPTETRESGDQQFLKLPATHLSTGNVAALEAKTGIYIQNVTFPLK